MTQPHIFKPAHFANQLNTGLKLRPEVKDSIPRLGDTQATLCVAATTIILAYGGIFGFVGIMGFYAMWFPRIKYRGTFTLKITRDVVYTMLFPTMACLSTIWSNVPSLSLYTALEYTSSILCAIIMARIVSPSSFIRGLNIGITITLIASIMSRRYGVDPFTGNYSLVGLFGSKNQVGLFAELGILSAIVGFLYPQKRLSKLFFCLGPLCLCIAALYMSKSTSSVLSLFIIIAMIISAYFITRLPKAYRTFACVIAVIWFTVLTVTALTLNWQDDIFHAFGKDSNMTGRTMLRTKGIQSGMNHPVLGHGYSAFWVQGNPVAEQMWYQFEIPARAGFHFHNLFIETFVGLGAVGAFLITLLLLQNIFKSFAGILKYGMEKEYIFALGIAIMFIIRAYVEVDLVGTFGIASIVFFGNLPRLATHEKEKRSLLEKGQSA